MARILVIDNDLEMQKFLQDNLCQASFSVTLANSHSTIMEEILHGNIDLVILELLIPKIDGFELCQQIRDATKIPIIISSISHNISDKVKSFECGVDDYITKPYDIAELIARIKALLRRMETQEMVFGALNVDSKRRIVKLNNQDIDLTNTEFDILIFLIDNRLQPISRDRIAHTINAIHDDTGLRSIDTHIRNLRNKLGDSAKEPKYIQSVWGIGYKFCL